MAYTESLLFDRDNLFSKGQCEIKKKYRLWQNTFARFLPLGNEKSKLKKICIGDYFL